MSLNWKEIDAVLAELDLAGAQLQKITQPAYDTIVLSLYKPGKATELLICVAHGACRIHTTRYPVHKTEKPQRFTELLRAHVRGARIESIEQLGTERILKIRLGYDDGERFLYARLWSGAANVILTKPDGHIIDVLARKPLKGEVAGQMYCPETEAAVNRAPREFAIRDFPEVPTLLGGGSINDRIDTYYAEHGSELSRDALLKKARAWLEGRRTILAGRLASLGKTAKEYADPERFREIGDILMANGQAAPVKNEVILDDFYRGGTVSVRIDPKKTIVQNAKDYYEKSKKAKSGAVETALEIESAQAAMDALEKDAAAVEREENPHEIRAFIMKRKTTTAADADRRFPGLSLEKDGWLMLIGRSAAENDQLLRRHVKGNDMWLHARDYSGAYVFIKARAGKSIPLETLLDAGTLALYYSKARSAGAGDLYYTHVKYLRRAKNGPKGLVIPMQEKNLHVRIEDNRIRELRRLIGHDQDQA